MVVQQWSIAADPSIRLAHRRWLENETGMDAAPSPTA
jgi:hypothetical protein